MSGDRALTGGVGLLERAVGYTLGILPAVRAPADLALPTPCRGWDLADLLAHLADSLAALREAAETGEVAPPAPLRPGDGGCPVARVRDGAYRLVGAWAGTDRPMVTVVGAGVTGGVVAGVGALEVAVHGWDVAGALGADRPLPEPLAAELLALAPLFVARADRPGRFDPPLPAAPGASAVARLLAFLGRAA